MKRAMRTRSRMCSSCATNDRDWLKGYLQRRIEAIEAVEDESDDRDPPQTQHQDAEEINSSPAVARNHASTSQPRPTFEASPRHNNAHEAPRPPAVQPPSMTSSMIDESPAAVPAHRAPAPPTPPPRPRPFRPTLTLQPPLPILTPVLGGVNRAHLEPRAPHPAPKHLRSRRRIRRHSVGDCTSSKVCVQARTACSRCTPTVVPTTWMMARRTRRIGPTTTKTPGGAGLDGRIRSARRGRGEGRREARSKKEKKDV